MGKIGYLAKKFGLRGKNISHTIVPDVFQTPIKPDPGTPTMLRVNIGTGGIREDRRKEIAPWLASS